MPNILVRIAGDGQFERVRLCEVCDSPIETAPGLEFCPRCLMEMSCQPGSPEVEVSDAR